MILPVYLSIIIIIIYSLLLLAFFIGWKRTGIFLPGKPGSYPFVSVVVAYRNEEKNIGQLLNDLIRQRYPSDRFEIIMVNDYSEDGSTGIVENCKLKSTVSISSVQLTDQQSGKKDAINQGIESSRGKYILLTDADCRVSENWISSYASFIQMNNDKPVFIIGLVDFKPSYGIFPQLQNLEFLCLVASGSGAAGIGMPIYCNSANLMFSRDTFDAINDPLKRKIVSGDDTFLLHHLKRVHPKEIFVLKAVDATVKTQPAASLKEFANQRIRWISKGRYYTDPHIVISSAIVILSNLVVLAWMIAAFVSVSVLYFLPFLFKMIVDWIWMIPVLSFFRQKKLHRLIPLLSLLYPFYVMIFSVAGLFGRYSWKGRHHSIKKPA